MGPGLPFDHGDLAYRDVRYGLADGGKHVEEGLTFRAEGQPSLILQKELLEWHSRFCQDWLSSRLSGDEVQ